MRGSLLRFSLQATQRGLEAVDEIARRLRLDGVYGPLYTLFETGDSFKTAVENIANARSVTNGFRKS